MHDVITIICNTLISDSVPLYKLYMLGGGNNCIVVYYAMRRSSGIVSYHTYN